MKAEIKAFKLLAVVVLLLPVLLSCIKTETTPSPLTLLTPDSEESTSPISTISPVTPPQLPPPSPLYAAPTSSPLVSHTPITSPAPTTTSSLMPTPTLTSPSLSVVPARPVPSLQIVATGLEIPWALAFAPDGRLFFTERPGRIRLIQQGRLLEEPVARLDVAHVGEAGLLGLALDPDFQANGYIYVYYTYLDSDRSLKNRVEQLVIKENRALDSKVLLDGIPANTIHDGGRLKFGPDSKLYITTGDSGSAQLSQDLKSLAGKILRLNSDGSIPQDNPFPGSPIFSYGNRNPEGMAWQPGTGPSSRSGQAILFSTEHGSIAHDELNIIKVGGNYGWPIITGKETRPGLIAPLIESGDDTWAPSGMTFYQGTVSPQWQGNLFFATLRGEHLQRIVLSGQEVTLQEKLFLGELGRLRDVLEGPDGFLYFSTSNKDGRGLVHSGDDHIYSIAPK